jgi:hypothetical protein
MQTAIRFVTALAAASVVAACATAPATAPAPAAKAAPPAPAPAPAAAAPTTATKMYYFMVMPEDGRLYVFGDPKNYLAYREHNEVPLTRSRIGAGPQGQTVVFGITNDDVKANRPSAAEMIYDKKIELKDPFYGEVFKDGRYHVFGSAKDFKDYLEHNEITYTFAMIGEGPKGASVIYALNRDTVKQGRPTAIIDEFKALRAGN